MKDHLFPLVLIGFGAVQLCSCERADDHERAALEEPEQLHADAVVAAEQGQSHPTEGQANRYEGIPDNQPVIHRVRAGTPGQDGWCLAKPTRGNFSVMLPGEYTDSMIKLTTTTGGTGVMHTVSTKTADGVEFNVLQTEILDERPSGSPVDLMIDRFKKRGATVSQEKVVLANRPAVKLRVTAQGVAADFILLSSSHNDYMLAVQSRPPHPRSAAHEADMERFFASFGITGGDE